MVKIAFISDIHGNAVALDAVLNDLKKKEVDKICVLGDISFRGPEPKRALDLVRSLNTDVIKGNADEWISRGIREGEVPETALQMMRTERQWAVDRLSDSDLDYLKSLPTELSLNIDEFGITGFHATPDSLFEIIRPTASDEEIEQKLMRSATSNVFVYAHIHKPYIRYINGKIIMNIGSVGLPFDGTPKASYGVIEIEDGNLRTSIERVSYDLEKVIQLYKELQYPNTEMMIKIIRSAKI